jgi:hypothetical protein
MAKIEEKCRRSVLLAAQHTSLPYLRLTSLPFGPPHSNVPPGTPAQSSPRRASLSTAFTTLQQDLGNSSSTQTTAATSGTDLTALGSALQSGDLNQAQNAFATLMQDLQNSIATLGSGASQAVGTVVNLTA